MKQYKYPDITVNASSLNEKRHQKFMLFVWNDKINSYFYYHGFHCSHANKIVKLKYDLDFDLFYKIFESYNDYVETERRKFNIRKARAEIMPLSQQEKVIYNNLYTIACILAKYISFKGCWPAGLSSNMTQFNK